MYPLLLIPNTLKTGKGICVDIKSFTCDFLVNSYGCKMQKKNTLKCDVFIIIFGNCMDLTCEPKPICYLLIIHVHICSIILAVFFLSFKLIWLKMTLH